MFKGVIMQKLTERQQRILTFIKETLRIKGAPPTRAEIATALGFKSANAAEDHLRALARKGAITLTAGASRGIRLMTALDDGLVQASAFLRSSLPVVGRVAAGQPILATEHVEATWEVDPSLFQQSANYLLKVCGMSMRDAGILDGDLLAVHKQSEARHGQIIVARLGDEVTVKRFALAGQNITLLPANPDFSPIEVGPDDAFEIEGLAVGLIRNTPL